MGVVGYDTLTVVFPGNLTVKLLHRCGLSAGLDVQLVFADDRCVLRLTDPAQCFHV